MPKPKNRQERKVYKDCALSSYEQELLEIQEYYPNVDGFFYSDHLGSWILNFIVGNDEEFETKEDMIDRLKAEASTD